MSTSPSPNNKPQPMALVQQLTPMLASALTRRLLPDLIEEMERMIPGIVHETLLQSEAMDKREDNNNSPNDGDVDSGAEMIPPMEQSQDALPQAQPQPQPPPSTPQQSQTVAAVPPPDKRVSDEVIVAKARERERMEGVLETREVTEHGFGG